MALQRSILANTKQLYNICTTSAQRRRRWSNIVQMLYKCFRVFLWRVKPKALTAYFSIRKLRHFGFSKQAATAPLTHSDLLGLVCKSKCRMHITCDAIFNNGRFQWTVGSHAVNIYDHTDTRASSIVFKYWFSTVKYCDHLAYVKFDLCCLRIWIFFHWTNMVKQWKKLAQFAY